MLKENKNIKVLKSKEIKKYISIKSLSTLDAMKRMNLTEEKFQIVVNSKKEVLGTITDGDIRRFLIKGNSIEDNVTKSMNKNPLIGKTKEDKLNYQKISKVNLYPSFLPIISKTNQINSIIISIVTSEVRTAMIMAGGLGSRLGKITKNIPKPLLKIGGTSILERIIKGLEQSGVNDIYISVNYLKEKIIKFITSKKFNSNITIVEERKKLGTVGSLSLINDKIKSPIILINADLITSLSISSFIEFYDENKPDAIIAAAIYEHKIPFGVLRYNELGELLGVQEKPIQKNLIAAGIYILNKKIVDLLDYNKKMDMPDLIERALKKGLNLDIFPIHENWTDIGLPEDYLSLLNKK